MGHIAAAGPCEGLLIGSPAVEVQREQPPAVNRRPVGALIDQAAAMGMTAAEIVGLTVPRLLPAGPNIKVVVVSMLVDQFIRERVGVDAVGLGEVSPGDQMPEMAVDRIDEEALPLSRPVVPPGVGRAGGEHLGPTLIHRVPPEAALHR